MDITKITNYKPDTELHGENPFERTEYERAKRAARAGQEQPDQKRARVAMPAYMEKVAEDGVRLGCPLGFSFFFYFRVGPFFFHLTWYFICSANLKVFNDVITSHMMLLITVEILLISRFRKLRTSFQKFVRNWCPNFIFSTVLKLRQKRFVDTLGQAGRRGVRREETGASGTSRDSSRRSGRTGRTTGTQNTRTVWEETQEKPRT